MSPRWIIPILGLGLALSPAVAQVRKVGPLKGMKGAKKKEMLDTFANMSPEQRERALAKLPPERRKQVEKNLARYNELTPEQKDRLQRQYDTFQQLPPEQQQAARQVFRRMNGLPQERRLAIRREVVRLGRMSDDERKAHVSSEEFKNRYSPDEQKMINELGGILSK